MENNQIKIFFTSKDDGNLAFHVGDDTDNVISNHKKLAVKHEYNLNSLVHMKQIHSDIVHIVNEDDNFNNPPTCDALVTNLIKVPLMVMVADCTPIIFHDARKGVISVVHAGRQGAFKNIIQKTIEVMKNTFNCEISDIHVTIGANICQKCYEVGEEIYHETKELNIEYSIMKKDTAYYLDVEKILLNQLKKLNIKDENITITDECSSCHNKKYYSYRKEGNSPQKTVIGRFAGVIQLL